MLSAALSAKTIDLVRLCMIRFLYVLLAAVLVAFVDVHMATAQRLSTPANDSLHIRSGTLPRLPCAPADSVEIPKESLILDHTPRVGSANAAIEIVQFYDVSCPHCLTFHDRLYKSLRIRYDTSQVAVYFRPFPISAESVPLLASLYHAEEMGRFAHLLESYYRLAPRRMSATTFHLYAATVGMEARPLVQAATSHVYRSRVLTSQQEARAIGVSGTPTVFVDGREIPPSSLKESCMTQIIDALLPDA